MKMTWKELQETCLRKMDSLDGANLVKDSNTTAYINAMPAAANEAMHILATVGRYWKKCLTIKQGGEDATEPTMQLGNMNAYELTELVDDFYCLQEVKLQYKDIYGKCGYSMEGDSLFLVPMAQEGEYRIWYNAYPPKITAATAADFEIGLPPEAANMIALYMAGQLYKHDDISIAQIWMNEFTAWLEELKISAARANGKNAASGGGWTSKKGYY